MTAKYIRNKDMLKVFLARCEAAMEYASVALDRQGVGFNIPVGITLVDAREDLDINEKRVCWGLTEEKIKVALCEEFTGEELNELDIKVEFDGDGERAEWWILFSRVNAQTKSEQAPSPS